MQSRQRIFPAPQLNGYVVHDQRIPSNPPDQTTTPGISEIELADAGATDVFLEGNLLTRCGEAGGKQRILQLWSCRRAGNFSMMVLGREFMSTKFP